MLFAGLILVGGGIGVEWWQGKDADDVADRISAIQEARIFSLNIMTSALGLMAQGRAAQFDATKQLLPNLGRFKGKGIAVFIRSAMKGLDPETDGFEQALSSSLRYPLNQIPKVGDIPPGFVSGVELYSQAVRNRFTPKNVLMSDDPRDIAAAELGRVLASHLNSIGIQAIALPIPYGGTVPTVQDGIQPGQLWIMIGQKSVPPPELGAELLKKLENSLLKLSQ